MSGNHHERVPGADVPAIIGVEQAGRWYVLVVRDFHGRTVALRGYEKPEEASKAEASLRAALGSAPRGDVIKAMVLWFRKDELRIELLQGWWT